MTDGDPWALPYPSQRQPVLGEEVVATSHPLAAQAGLELLAAGGTAVDAAVGAAAALTVVEPTSNGIGGDAFAIVWDGGRSHGLNASGRSPNGLDVAALLGRPSMPLRGWATVTVPGAVSAWAALHRRFGRLPFTTVLAPAIRLAADGHLVAPITAAAWAASEDLGGDAHFAATFLPDGRAPRAGTRFRAPDHARTLQAIADSGGEDVYRGDLAERIAAHAAAGGGALRRSDLAAHEAAWLDPIGIDAGVGVVEELPPNGQGLAALVALGVLARTPARELPLDGADRLHWQIEAVKLGLADARAHVADPARMRVSTDELLDPDRLTRLAQGIDPRRAGDPGHGAPQRGGTVYLAAGDREGQLVSLIQSNFHGFGSGLVVPGTGIALHNRGAGFSTDPAHPNAVAPGTRPFHTIIPALVRPAAAGGLLAALGVMGGAMQPQGHVQVVERLGAGQGAQAAIDAPRWRVEAGREVAVESGVRTPVLDALRARGHRVTRRATAMGGFGGAQVVQRLPEGLLGASDPRKDGQAVAR